MYDKTLRIDENEYFPGVHPKSLIVLHHTVGGSAASTRDWWNLDPKRIGTAYMVERDGTVFEVFPPEAWASHINRKDAKGNQIVSLEQRSIGIELCNHGPLTLRDGKFYRVVDRRPHVGKVHDCGKVWRDYQYFCAYPPEQMAATAKLVRDLCAKFGIAAMTYPNDYLADGVTGIVTHAQLRLDKSDVHPGFAWELL